MDSQLPLNERPAGSPPARTSGSLLIGGFLVLVGVIFLLNSLGIARVVLPDWNWPALLLLFPMFWAARSAWQAYQANGEQMNPEARDKAVWAVIFLIFFGMAFYGWRWGQIWPVILIAVGAAMLLRHRKTGTTGSL
jgi:hypothetical protein